MSEFIVKCRRTGATTSSTVAEDTAIVTVHHGQPMMGCSSLSDVFTLALPGGEIIALRPGQVTIDTDVHGVDGHEQDHDG